MLMQVLIQHISDIEKEFMAWFYVFFLEDVIEIWQLVGYFEKQAIPWIFWHSSVSALWLSV